MKHVLAWSMAAAMAVAQDRGPLQLSLRRAVEIATSPEGSTQIQLSQEALKQAELRSKEARAALLPDLESGFVYQNRTANLAAQGITLTRVPFPGFAFPTFVGPFNTMDARITASQNVLNLSSILQYQASRAGVSAAKSDSETSSEQVAALVARAYLVAVRPYTDLASDLRYLAIARMPAAMGAVVRGACAAVVVAA